MADEEKPEQTPQEKIAKLAAMTDEKFSQFMHWNFNRVCKQAPDKAPDSSALMPPRTET